MKVFVTGGAGYIGSICVEELLNAGHQVTVFDNLSEGHRVAVDERAQFIEGCLSDRETILNAVAADQSEAVMHFAAFAQVGESMTDPSKYFRNNVANGINLLDAAVEAGVKKFVFSSTAATYGMPDSVPITEQEPQKPINPYGESKLMFETILKWYRELHGLEFVAFRYFNAAGCSEKLGEERRVETHLIPNVLRVALGQRRNAVFSAPTTPLRTAPVSATTFTSSISPRLTYSRSSRANVVFTISATARATPSGK